MNKTERPNQQELAKSLTWLAGAPPFIDGNQACKFYDAVIPLANREGTVTFERLEERIRDLEGMLQIQAGLAIEKLADLPVPVSASLKPVLKPTGQEYWHWFADHYSPTGAMTAFEIGTEAKGCIRSIDYRLPISTSGDSLDPHVVGAGDRHRCFCVQLDQNGIQPRSPIGPHLKSEPDVNALAIYEK